MVRPMTKEEYERLFKKPEPPTSTNGSAPFVEEKADDIVPVFATPIDPNAADLTEDDINALDAATAASYERRFVKEDWQTIDIIHLLRHHDRRIQEVKDEEPTYAPGVANWSEMGCYKTSTGLWLAENLINEAVARRTLDGPKIPTGEFPSILIITSKGGKGTFLEAIPELLPEYTIINVETQALFYYKDGHMLKLDKSVKFVPEKFGMPTICLAHYPIFARSNYMQFETDDDGLPIQLDGKFIFKPWLQADWIANRIWDIVLCDEFHRLKDRDSKWTVNIKRIPARVAKHGMTGTGFINRPDEIWSLLNWLDPKAYGSYWDFYEEFCEIDDWDGYAKVSGIKPEKKEKFREIVRTIGVRRTLSQVMPHIKVPLFKPETVELNAAQRKMYDALKMELEAEDQKGTPLYAANVLSMLQRLRQICVATPEVISQEYDPDQDRMVQKIRLVEPSSKLDRVMEILEDLQWDDELKEPLVIFSNFKDPLDLLRARLDKHNERAIEMGVDDMVYKYLHLDVGDSDVVRYRKWHDEFPTMQYRIFMSTLQLGGESINLTPARHVVFLDRSWSPKDNAQGIGRIRRPGQEGQPVVIHINAKDTTDQYIERVNDIKHGWFKQIFGNE